MRGSLPAVPIPGGPRPNHAPAARLADVAALAGTSVGAESAGVAVRGITLSSLTVRPGDVYAALPGSRAHGADYAAAAAAAGAVAILTDPAGAGPAAATRLPVLVVADPRGVLGDVAAGVYGRPGERLQVFAITGTNGKTTSTFLLDSALRGQGRRTGLIGTVEIRVGDERVLATGTTPEAPDLHALLAVMLEHEVSAVAMEVSSHALAQHRMDGLLADVAGFTNLTQDHLDYHHSMAEYYAAKATLFTPRHARCGVVCVDDAWGARLAGEAAVPVVTVASRTGVPADWTVRDEGVSGGLPQGRVCGPGGVDVLLRSPLPGHFNLANSLVALVMLVQAGSDPAAAARAIGAAGPVPGRMEPVPGPGAPGEPLAVVDYAHSPDAVANALSALGDAGRPLVVVLGAGGERDRAKRPLMGEVAARGADVVVVTDDNPRSEDPAEIRAAVLDGARRVVGATVLEVPSRRAAVAEAVALAWGGGTVLLAGKGHEHGQEIAGQVLPFDDRDVLREALADAARTGVQPAGSRAGHRPPSPEERRP